MTPRSSKLMFIASDAVRAVRLNYEPDVTSPNDTVAKCLIPDIEVDDLVVVQTSTRHKLTVAKVVEVDVDVDFDDKHTCMWVTQRIDPTILANLIEQEQEVINRVNAAEARKRREEMRKTMTEYDDSIFEGLTLIESSQEEG